jgi:quinol monooxygenase YgiN
VTSKAPIVGDDVELALVTMVFDVDGPDTERLEKLEGILAKYVVLSRGHPGCRTIDLCASVTRPGRLVVLQKWETPAHQRAHFDSAEMVEMAQACRGVLARAPEIDLLESISAHDLR